MDSVMKHHEIDLDLAVYAQIHLNLCCARKGVFEMRQVKMQQGKHSILSEQLKGFQITS